MQLIKMLNWNISVDSNIEIEKVIYNLKGFPTRPDKLIFELEELKREGVKTVDKYEMIDKLEKL